MIDGKLAIDMSARVWSAIDANMDNVVSLGAQTGDAEAVRRGQAIRAEGSKQVPWVDGQWPAMSLTLSIELARSQWEYVLQNARQAIAIYGELRDAESQRLCEQIVSIVSAAL